MTKWEYRKVSNDNLSVDELNRFGKQGWELVSTELVATYMFGEKEYNYLFKRKL